MTEAQIEAAARRLCEIRGQNPNDHVQVACDCGNPLCGNTKPEYAWKAVEWEIRDFLQVRDAIAGVLN